MQTTRMLAVIALVVSLGLAIGAFRPAEPAALGAMPSRPIIMIATPLPALAEPLPALAELQPAELQPAEPLQVEPLPAEPLPVEPLPAEPIDPASQYGTPEFFAALADDYKSLPTIQCPCGPENQPAEPITDRQRLQSRNRTR